MTATSKTISGLVESQLPDFINADHPKFKRFVELYYTWLENNSPNGISNTAGNTVYHAMGIENYRDIDQTPAEFIKYFKEELLPYFPENTSLSTEKIIKSAREFYSKKGSDESVRWLFKALFDEDIELTYPKEEILKTSDGKWIKPRAFRITVTEFNKNVDVNLLEKRLVYGTESGATCIVESANRNIDPTNGREIMEIYISNIKKYFNNGELIEINYVDANGVSKVFSERIIGTLSNIRINSNIRTDPQQRRRGLLYNIGDPVVITGGLGNSPEANDAAAIVGNVTLGSIEAVTMVFPGYGYRLYSNTETIVYRSVGDDPNANLSTDLRVLQLNSSACTTNSQLNFIESITYDKTVIDYLADTLIGNANYAAFTTNTRNSLINVTENDSEDPFNNFEEVWANGTNFSDALFTAKIATPNGNTRIGGTVSFLGDTSISGTISVYGNIALTGTVSTNVSNWYITGNGTSFLSEITAGEYVTVLDQARQVVSVDSNIKLTLSQPFSFTRTGLNAYKGNTTIIGSGTTFTSSINVNDFLVVNNEIAKVANVVNNTILIVSSPFSFTGSGYTAHKNLYSTALSVIGNSTNFISTLSPGQQLEVNGDRAIIANIANDTFLNVVAAYSSTFSDNTAYRIGSFAANGGFGTEYTGDMIFYDVSNIGPLATILAGSQINTRNTAKSFVVNSLATASMNANSNSMIIQCLDFDTVNTGGVALVSVLNGGAGFRSEPAIDISSHYDTHLSEQYSYASQKALKRTYWQTFKDLGLIAHVYINNGGDGYSIGDGLRFSGRGYNANGYVQSVSGTGAITSVILDNRGEGYYSRPLITVQSSGGANAVLTGYLFGDGEEHTIETSAVGRIRDIRLLYRGYDYTATPNVSLKIVDTIINPVPEANTFSETEIIYQGASLATSTFRANVKSYDANTGLLRLYNFSGAINKTVDLITANGVYCNVNTSANVPAPAQYPSTVIATGLPNPMYYGNGRARANAQFANGLIEFNGFFLNTDGFVSADKVLQDDTIYHNFSYVVQSEKNLVDFETPIKNIVHPSGLELISKTVVRSEDQAEIPVYANVDLIMPGNGTSNIQVSNSYSNVVIGNSTLFMPNVGSINYSNTRVNVGDLFIVIDSTRLPISRIVSNVVSNTQLEVYGDFIYAGQGLVKSNVAFTALTGTAATTNDSVEVVGTGTAFDTELEANNIIKVNNEIREIITVTNAEHLIVNANLNYTSTAQTVYKLANTTLVVYGNTNGVYEMVQAGDNVSFNIAAANVMGAQTGTVQVFTTNTLVVGTSTSFLTQIKANDIVMINGQLKQVINIANNTVMNVNASHASNTSGMILYKRATSQNASVLSVSGNAMTLNIAYNANVSNLVYLVAPNLATEDLGFTVVTLTAY